MLLPHRIDLGAETYFIDSKYGGQPASGIGIQLAPGSNALATATAVRAKIDELAPYFPHGLQVVYPYDTTPFVKISITEVVKTLFEGILLVFLVMYLFLQNLRATLIPTIAVPVVLTALEGSITLAEAMEARGYGSGPRTHYSEQPWHRGDVVVAIVAPVAAAVLVALRVAGAIGDWYPFPELTWPAVQVGGVACCLALALPLLVWRR